MKFISNWERKILHHFHQLKSSVEKGVKIFIQKWTLSKMLQILHAVLFRCVKQCSMCFLAEVCFIFEILSMQKHIFPRASLNWGPFVEWKTKETFCFAKWWSLHDNIILIAYYCFNRPDLNLFCCDTSSIQDRSTFFSLCSFTSFKNQDIFFKKIAI